MEVVRTVAEMRRHAEKERCAGKTLALVPTMGALHKGHLQLVQEARQRADHLTISIFVNPTQFGPGEDYERYPRALEKDLKHLEQIGGGVDCVFAPTVEEMYPGGLETPISVTVKQLDEHLCGRHRPGHFNGVTTVVTKLLLSCRPHLAVFGKKDAQQYVILRRLVEALPFGTQIVGVPTVREADGLALSSRNKYLSDEERKQAVVLSQAVSKAKQAVQKGEQRTDRIVEAMLRQIGTASNAKIQYAEVVDATNLQPVEEIAPEQEVLAAVAVFFGETRLIDNVFVTAPQTN